MTLLMLDGVEDAIETMLNSFEVEEMDLSLEDEIAAKQQQLERCWALLRTLEGLVASC